MTKCWVRKFETWYSNHFLRNREIAASLFSDLGPVDYRPRRGRQWSIFTCTSYRQSAHEVWESVEMYHQARGSLYAPKVVGCKRRFCGRMSQNPTKSKGRSKSKSLSSIWEKGCVWEGIEVCRSSQTWGIYRVKRRAEGATSQAIVFAEIGSEEILLDANVDYYEGRVAWWPAFKMMSE